MNAPCKQLRSMKGPQCAWSIWRDVGQGLRMLEAFPCSCDGAPLARGQVLEPARGCLCLWLTFMHRELTSNRWKDVFDMCVECFKRLYFWQVTLFAGFFSFILACDTWPMIDILGGHEEVTLGVNILFTQVVKTTSCKADWNQEPDECTV